MVSGARTSFPFRMASHSGSTFQKIAQTSEGVIYPMGHKVVGSYPPLFDTTAVNNQYPVLCPFSGKDHWLSRRLSLPLSRPQR